MITVQGLTKRFPTGRGEVLAVDDLCFSVAAGEVYGLLGPNGAGKTTTLRMILGLLQATSGYAEVAGFRSSNNPNEVKRRVGLVSTSAGLYPWLTPRETLSFFAAVYGVPTKEAQQAVARLSDLMQLDTFLDRRNATLSTGQKQRVNLARALIHDPPVMLLDEPTHGLDIVGRGVVLDYISHLRDRGKAVILCTHQLDEAERGCDRFGLLHLGRLVYEGTLAELRTATGQNTLAAIFIQILSNRTPLETARESSA